MVYVVRLLKFGAAALAVAFASSCSPKKGTTSSVTIELPSAHSSGSNKTASQSVSALSFDYTNACFAVNVTAPDIPQASSSCSPPLGIFSGFKPSGTTVTLEVPMGSSRKIEVLYYNRGASTSCASDFTTVSADKVTMVGSLSGVDMNKPETTATVMISTPAAGVNAVTQYGLPASCIASAAPSGTGSSQQIVLGAGRLTNAGYIIQGQVSFKQTMTELNNGSYKMLLGPKGL